MKVRECAQKFTRAKRALWEAEQASLYDYDAGSGNSLLSASPASREKAVENARAEIERTRDWLILALADAVGDWGLDLDR